MSLSVETKTKFVTIIDSILAASDLNTISEKRVRKGLQAAVDYDISPFKDEIKELIMLRFDKFMADPGEKTNGHSQEPQNGHTVAHRDSYTPDADLSEPIDTPKPKKRKMEPEEDDAAFAARLQAMENSRIRSTRGAAKPTKSAKRKSPKKKTSARVRSEDDSDIEGSDHEVKKRKVNRDSGFHKELFLSPPLSALLNEQKLSRPQTVKRIWEYVRARELQDPKDKRMIRCDEAMRAVFKLDKVHMFTMNKILNQNLYAQDE